MAFIGRILALGLRMNEGEVVNFINGKQYCYNFVKKMQKYLLKSTI